MDIFNWFKPKQRNLQSKTVKKETTTDVAISPGRTSVPETGNGLLSTIKGVTDLIEPSFRDEVIPLLRDLYKVNPDIGIALQDMFKLANTGHTIRFPNNTEKEAQVMREFLENSSKEWGLYHSGMYGIVNRMMVQCLIGGAVSIEAVPNKGLNNLSTILFINPENIRFSRKNDGRYTPYQKVKVATIKKPKNLVKLNEATFIYAPLFNDTDEPYGIPTFMPALDSIDGQYVMRNNFKQIMEQVGLLGFLEAKMQKPDKRPNESEPAYIQRLNGILTKLKNNLKEGMSDGIVVGYIDDHEFDLKSTTKNLSNVDKMWEMNQQSVANGLGVSGNIIGIANANTEGGAGILLSKLISQLRNVQEVTQISLARVYNLALLLGGYNNKGIQIEFGPSTISDDLKIQQAREIKIRNNKELYLQGIIGQQEYAWDLGYSTPHKSKPLLPIEAMAGIVKEDPEAKEKKEKDKDTGDRAGRDKKKENPKRADQDPKPRKN